MSSSTATPQLPIAIFHEHTEWFKPLFAEFERRGVPYVRINAASHVWDPSDRTAKYSLVVNRASPSAYIRGNGGSTFNTLHWLKHVEALGIPVVNGSDAYGVEISKAHQLELLEQLGIAYPRSRVINDPKLALQAAEGLRYPVLVKANIGGSGAGIVKYDSAEAIQKAIDAGTIPIGLDGVSLVQEAAPLRDGHITRVEALDGKYLYAIDVYPDVGSFDLCPADACQTTDGAELVRGACAVDAPKNGLKVTKGNAPSEIIDAIERIVQLADIDIGGVEYLIDDRDGKAYVYDINALSNFVADAPRVIGFDPWVNFVDYLVARANGSERAAAFGRSGGAESLEFASASRAHLIDSSALAIVGGA
ncbi:MAG: ATP-grasp domain-containing protein [Gemmatimonas sp.]